MIRPVKRATNLHSITPNNIATQPILQAGSLLPLCLSFSPHRPLLSLLNTAYGSTYVTETQTQNTHTCTHSLCMSLMHARRHAHTTSPSIPPNPPIHYVCACLRVSPLFLHLSPRKTKNFVPLSKMKQSPWLSEEDPLELQTRASDRSPCVPTAGAAYIPPAQRACTAGQALQQECGAISESEERLPYTLQWCYAMEVSFRQRKTRLKPDAWPPSRISRSPGQTPFGLK